MRRFARRAAGQQLGASWPDPPSVGALAGGHLHGTLVTTDADMADAAVATRRDRAAA